MFLKNELKDNIDWESSLLLTVFLAKKKIKKGGLIFVLLISNGIFML